MDKAKIIYASYDKLEPKERKDGVFNFNRRSAVEKGQGKLKAAFIEILPGKSNFPYHYHINNEELFYIISGKGILRTPDGEREVLPGDVILFPNNENGAHRLSNPSETEPLVYLDVDSCLDPEICIYPDSNKICGFDNEYYGMFRRESSVDYYDREKLD